MKTYKYLSIDTVAVIDKDGISRMSGLAAALVPDGVIPEPADIPDPKEAIRAQIAQLEQAQLMPRATREFMLLFVEQNNLTAMPGYAPLKAFDDQIKLLRNQLV